MLNIFISGGPVMYPLLACSIISLTVVIERLIFWVIMNRYSNRQLLDEVMELCEAGNWETVRLKTAGSQDPIIKILIRKIN